METHMTALVMGTAQVGQLITKNTGVSVALVVMLMGATMWATTAFTSTENRMDNMEADISEIKSNQDVILEAVIK